jgi:hypothetical protein
MAQITVTVPIDNAGNRKTVTVNYPDAAAGTFIDDFAELQGYQTVIPNPDFDRRQPLSETNQQYINNPADKADSVVLNIVNELLAKLRQHRISKGLAPAEAAARTQVESDVDTLFNQITTDVADA